MKVRINFYEQKRCIRNQAEIPKRSVYIHKNVRMLEPKELYGCQGFPDDYIIDHDYTGKTYPRSEQVRRCGNAVCPPIPAALVRANLPELCVAERTPNMRIEPEQTGQLRFA